MLTRSASYDDGLYDLMIVFACNVSRVKSVGSTNCVEVFGRSMQIILSVDISKKNVTLQHRQRKLRSLLCNSRNVVVDIIGARRGFVDNIFVHRSDEQLGKNSCRVDDLTLND